jgi:hypothetical protein
MQELVKDFNQFESLYRKQVEVTQQTQAYNRPGQLEREDQLALKDLAAAEQQMGESLRDLRTKLGEDAKNAQKLFPKASHSGQDLADQIGQNLMAPLADQATDKMLAGDGEQSSQMTERLRLAMERLFTQCQAGDCPSPNELDSYLRLQRLTPGNNFAQMSRSKKFGSGKGYGMGGSGGSGEGEMGSSGYAVSAEQNMEVMGNENFVSNSNALSRQSSKFGHGAAAQGAAARGETGNPDVLNGLNPVNRHSAANSSETINEEYHDVVDNYFKAIATKKEKPPDDKSN